jgi:hypothetical protein
MDPNEPLLYDDDRNTPSPLLQDQVSHTLEPWRGSGEGLLAQVGDHAEGRLCIGALKMEMDRVKNHRCNGGPCAR